jgi:hypothetical protein
MSGELIRSRVGTFTRMAKYMAVRMGAAVSFPRGAHAHTWLPSARTHHRDRIYHQRRCMVTGLSILELIQNRFPLPGDLALVDLIMHITSSQVGGQLITTRKVGTHENPNIMFCKPPQLEDEPDLGVTQ